MKIKLLSLAILSTIATQSFALTKTIDFYSTNGTNRYSVSGTLGEAKDIESFDNKLIIGNANNETYLTLNGNTPYHIHFNDNDLNIYQIFENNKGKEITYKNEKVKVVSLQGENLIAENNEGLIFIPLNQLVLPKKFLNEGKKGLKATFDDNVKLTDKIYYSQPDNSLSYSNSYQGTLDKDSVKFTHYLNIQNASQNVFENVYLNFFLSETNIQRSIRPLARGQMMKANLMMAEASSDSMERPQFETNNIQNIELISIKDPVNIYPNQNKLRYTEKSYPKEEYASLKLEPEYRIYFGDDIDIKSTYTEFKTANTNLNNLFNKKVDGLVGDIKNNDRLFENIIDIKTDKGDILPSGKIDLYEKLDDKDKLIVSTNIDHVENKNIELLKNINRDLKIVDIKFYDIPDESYKKTIKDKYFKLLIKSVVVENVGKQDYTINLFNKKTIIKKNEKITLNN